MTDCRRSRYGSPPCSARSSRPNTPTRSRTSGFSRSSKSWRRWPRRSPCDISCRAPRKPAPRKSWASHDLRRHPSDALQLRRVGGGQRLRIAPLAEAGGGAEGAGGADRGHARAADAQRAHRRLRQSRHPYPHRYAASRTRDQGDLAGAGRSPGAAAGRADAALGERDRTRRRDGLAGSGFASVRDLSEPPGGSVRRRHGLRARQLFAWPPDLRGERRARWPNPSRFRLRFQGDGSRHVAGRGVRAAARGVPGFRACHDRGAARPRPARPLCQRLHPNDSTGRKAPARRRRRLARLGQRVVRTRLRLVRPRSDERDSRGRRSRRRRAGPRLRRRAAGRRRCALVGRTRSRSRGGRDSDIGAVMRSNEPGPDEIEAAHARISGHVRRTPLLETASPVAGAPPISLKLEFLQHAGSFKPRGAFNNLLTRAAPPIGCATASGGNHGAAVAYAAGRLGIRARVFVPEIAAPVKIAKIKAFGADVHVGGATYYEALALCDAYVADSGALAVHAYDSAATIAGQGTVGREWEQDLARLGAPALDTVLVAVGGGGLIAGIAAWFARAPRRAGGRRSGRRRSAIGRGRFAWRSAGRRSLLGDLSFGSGGGRARHGRGHPSGAARFVAGPVHRRRTRRRRGSCGAGERRLPSRAGRACRRPAVRRERGSGGVPTLGRATQGTAGPKMLRAAPARTMVRPLRERRPARRGLMGRSQAVRQRILIPPSPGSNPGAPAKYIKMLVVTGQSRSAVVSAPCRPEAQSPFGMVGRF